MSERTEGRRARARIGSGAGFAGDRIGPAVDLVRHGELDDLVLECLAERTIAQAQQRRLTDPGQGYDLRAEQWLRALLPVAAEQHTRLVSNLGAANPWGAGRLAARLATELGLRCRVAVVGGDDVLDRLDLTVPALEDGLPLEAHGEVVSANAYLGAEAITPALATGADVVLTGRVADPSLFVAPLADRLGWDLDDPADAAHGTLVGHLLECGTQLTGGYFADPGPKDVAGLAELGYPWADVDATGGATLGKLKGTGGVLDRRTAREQLLYEITDPRAYLTPDVVLDLGGVTLEEVAPDRVRVTGARGRARPDRLKVSVGYRAGWRAEAGLTYAGPGCVQRARLAGEVVRRRLAGLAADLRIDVVGTLDDDAHGEVSECWLRVAGMSASTRDADAICHEVESLYTNGPAGGGGVRAQVTEVIGIVSTLIDRDRVEPTVAVVEEES